MTNARLRFSISHLLEAITALAISLALGKVIPPGHHQPGGAPYPSFLLILAGGAVGAYLGVRLFRRKGPLRCSIKTIPLAMFMTGVNLLPYYSMMIARYGSIFSHRMMIQWTLAFVACLIGGIFGGVFAAAIVDVWRSSASARK